LYHISNTIKDAHLLYNVSRITIPLLTCWCQRSRIIRWKTLLRLTMGKARHCRLHLSMWNFQPFRWLPNSI